MAQTVHPPRASPEQARRSLWIPWVFVGMFGIIIAVNAAMAIFAFGSWTGLSADDPYRRGLVHNQSQAAIARQEQLGWDIAVGAKPLGERRVRLRLRIRNADREPVTWAKVKALLVRPVSQGQDFAADLRHTGDGVYEADISFPAGGLWEARYQVRTRRHRLHAVRRLEVR